MICYHQHKADGSPTECDPKYCQEWDEEKKECSEPKEFDYSRISQSNKFPVSGNE